MTKNILVTGGAGFIGSNLSLKLIDRGYNVTVLDNLSNQIHGAYPNLTSPLYQSIINKVNFIKGTVTSLTDLKQAITNQDIIVHLAAETGTGQSMYQIDHYVNVNIGGTALLLDLLTNTKHKVKKVIVASSRSVYGEGKYLSPETGFVYPAHRLDDDMKKGDFEVKYPGCSQPITAVATDEKSKIHPLDQAILNIEHDIFRVFVKKWTEHTHAKNTIKCNHLLVLDGNWKVNRLKCTFDNIWKRTKEFGEYMIGCKNTPEKFGYFCEEHKDYELEFVVDQKIVRVKPRDIIISRISK